MTAQVLLSALAACLAESSLLVSEEELKPYECDGLSVYKGLPLAVVLPETIEQAQAIIQLCQQQHTPIIARGAGTGLAGGVMPTKGAVVLSLAKFNRVLNVDLENRTATVQPGVRNLAISEAVAVHG
ncbi:MAG: FAD-binding protein, partial [Ghiorsea sp.]|nr:FAD-binding protein [Ghiorsea sp.]